MGELRRLPAEGSVEQDLLRSIADVIAPARHEGDVHLVVVDGRGQVVERVAVGSHQDEVLLGGVGRLDGAEDLVDEVGAPLTR